MSFVVLAVLPQLLEAKDHVGHSCRSKLVQNLLLKFYQSLTNFQQNLIKFSKTTKLLSLLLLPRGELWGSSATSLLRKRPTFANVSLGYLRFRGWHTHHTPFPLISTASIVHCHLLFKPHIMPVLASPSTYLPVKDFCGTAAGSGLSVAEAQAGALMTPSSHLHKKSEGVSGTPSSTSVGTAPSYQSLQRKASTNNKRVSVFQSPQRHSGSLPGSASSGSGQGNCDSNDSSARSTLSSGLPSTARGGIRYSSPH